MQTQRYVENQPALKVFPNCYKVFTLDHNRTSFVSKTNITIT